MTIISNIEWCRGGSRIFRTSVVKIFLADGALSALGVVWIGRGRRQAGGGGGGGGLNNFFPMSFWG